MMSNANSNRSLPPFWGTEAGHSLLKAVDPLGLAVFAVHIGKQAGLDESDYPRVYPWCGYPLPGLHEVAPRAPLAKKVTNLEWLGHPIFWLFGDVLMAQSAPASSEFDTEPVMVTALRLALQMEITGLFDVENGEWANILDAIGLNVEDPFDVIRIKAWQNGAADSLLDGFNLGDTIMKDVPASMVHSIIFDANLLGIVASYTGTLSAFLFRSIIVTLLEGNDVEQMISYAQLIGVMVSDFVGSVMDENVFKRWLELTKNVESVSSDARRDVGVISGILQEMFGILDAICVNNDDIVDGLYQQIQALDDEIANLKVFTEE